MSNNAEKAKLPAFMERFNRLRGEMTQDEFAQFLKISRPTVGFYENGDRIPDALTLRKICERCQVSADWLLGLSDVSNPDITLQAISQKTGLSERAVDVLTNEKWTSDECASSLGDEDRAAAHAGTYKLLNALVSNESDFFFLGRIYNEYCNARKTSIGYFDVMDLWQKVKEDERPNVHILFSAELARFKLYQLGQFFMKSVESVINWELE